MNIYLTFLNTFVFSAALFAQSPHLSSEPIEEQLSAALRDSTNSNPQVFIDAVLSLRPESLKLERSTFALLKKQWRAASAFSNHSYLVAPKIPEEPQGPFYFYRDGTFFFEAFIKPSRNASRHPK